MRRAVEAAIDLGIHDLSVFAFSTENWSRPQDEVDALMEIFAETIERELPDLAEQGVRVRFIGRRDRAPDGAAAADGGDGGPDRPEHAAQPVGRVRLRRACGARRGGAADRRERRRPAEIDENVFAANLYAPELPDPDLLIRTSGELRISNFLLWQLAYASSSSSTSCGPTSTSATSRTRSPTTPHAADASAGDEGTLSNAVSRIVFALVLIPVVLGAVYFGGWWMFAFAAVAALIATHEYTADDPRSLGPLALAGYVGSALALARSRAAGIDWMFGGALVTLVLAFLLKAISDARAAGDRRGQQHGARRASGSAAGSAS